jgi:hypothetical protein
VIHHVVGSITQLSEIKDNNLIRATASTTINCDKIKSIMKISSITKKYAKD